MSKKGNAVLHKVIDDPKATGKAILHGVGNYFKEGFTDIAAMHSKGDYLGAGRSIGKLGLDGYLFATCATSLGIQGLDLAIGTGKVLGSAAKATGNAARSFGLTAFEALADSVEATAPRSSLLAFQYQSQLRAAALVERETNLAAKAAAVVKNKELQRELRRAAQARRVVDSSSSASSGSVFDTPMVDMLTQEHKIKTVGIPEAQVSDMGLYRPEPLLPEELSKIVELQNARNQYLKWQRELDIPIGLSEETQSLLSKYTAADRVITKNMKPDDLAGILKEGRGVKIFKKDGRIYSHGTEMDQAHHAIVNTFERIEDRLIEVNKINQYNSVEGRLLQEKLSKLSKFKDLYTELTREAKCLTSYNKPKP